jgi:hypothetical protein
MCAAGSVVLKCTLETAPRQFRRDGRGDGGFADAAFAHRHHDAPPGLRKIIHQFGQRFRCRQGNLLASSLSLSAAAFEIIRCHQRPQRRDAHQIVRTQRDFGQTHPRQKCAGRRQRLRATPLQCEGNRVGIGGLKQVRSG